MFVNVENDQEYKMPWTWWNEFVTCIILCNMITRMHNKLNTALFTVTLSSSQASFSARLRESARSLSSRSLLPQFSLSRLFTNKEPLWRRELL